MVVGWLFIAMLWGCLRFVIVVFPGHARLLFFTSSVTTFSIVGLYIIGRLLDCYSTSLSHVVSWVRCGT